MSQTTVQEVKTEESNTLNLQVAPSLHERFSASVVLAAVGDAIGYNNGSWEFNCSGRSIHSELQKYFGGRVGNIEINGWRVSDDTVMHIASIKAIIKENPLNNDYKTDLNKYLDAVMYEMGVQYIDCFDDMGGRAPGGTCGGGVRLLSRLGRNWRNVPYSSFGGGCGASMRSAAIGLLYHGAEWREHLIAISIESGRLTHNHPTGFLGAMVASAFTALAIEGVPVVRWGTILLRELLPLSRQYLQQCNRDWVEIERDMKRFEQQWTEYLEIRGLLNVDENNASTTRPKFPDNYGIDERDEFYNKWSFRGWAGASGDDSVIIAYDALLGAGDNWENLMERGALHAGDSDSTGTIAGAWWGAIYGFYNVSKLNTENLEKREELNDLSNKVYEIRDKMNKL